MGKNLDMSNIFNSYMNNVLLKEDNNNPLQGVSDAIPKLQELLNTSGLSEEAKKNIQAQIDNAKKATSQPQASPSPSPSPKASPTPQPQASPSPSPAPQASSTPQPKASATPESKPNLSPVSIGGMNIGAPLVTTPPTAPTTQAPTTQTNQMPTFAQKVADKNYQPKDRSEADAINKARQQVSSQQTTQPITKTPEGGMALNGITVGSPTGSGTTQQQIPSSAGVDVKIPASLQSPALMPQQQEEPLKVGDNITIGKPEAAKEAPIQQTKQQAPSGKAKTSGGSIVDYLASKGQASDRASRAKLAAQYGIQNYTGTAEQNTKLLSMLKSGQQPTKAAEEPAAKEQPKQKKGMGGIVRGVSKAIGSAGQGVKQATIGTKKPLGGIFGLGSRVLGTLGKGVKTALVGNQEEDEEGWVQQGETEVENVSDQYDTEETPAQYKESFDIAKFLKCLSEKNYHQANIHLNEIIQNKVKKKLSNSIK